MHEPKEKMIDRQEERERERERRGSIWLCDALRHVGQEKCLEDEWPPLNERSYAIVTQK